MAARTSAIIEYLDELLDSRSFPDFCPNGLQVPGNDRITKVATAVSADADVIERAAAESADLLLVHHGLFWRGQPMQITELMHRRLRPLYEHEIALAAYHLPLDAHVAHGNNALLANALQTVDQHPFAGHEGRHIGVAGRFEPAIELAQLTERVQAAVGGRPPLVIPGAGDRVRTIGIVSGAATDYVHEAIELGFDAFLTGEPAERAYGIARDAGIAFIAAGHYATETLGVRRLGELLARDHGVEHLFIDSENPI